MIGVLALLALLGIVSIVMSELHGVSAVLASLVTLGFGAYAMRREWRSPHMQLAFKADGTLEVDGRSVEHVDLQQQGPLTRVTWRSGGRTTRWVAWPDIVDAATRRELRLWALAHRGDGKQSAMAG